MRIEVNDDPWRARPQMPVEIALVIGIQHQSLSPPGEGGNAVTAPPPARLGLAPDTDRPDGGQHGPAGGNTVTAPPPASLDLPGALR